MHDINLVHMLETLGYFSENESGNWNNVLGVDFNSSIRFEVYETVMYASDALNFLPQPYVKILYDDMPIPCNDFENDTANLEIVCPLAPFIENIRNKVLISAEALAEVCNR